MEAPISVSQGVIRSLPAKLESLLADPDNGLRKGAKNKIRLLKEDIEKLISEYLMVEPSEASTARCWVQGIRELSYDIEAFAHDLDHADAVKNNLANEGPTWVSDEASRFRTRVDAAVRRYKDYDLGQCKRRQSPAGTDDQRPVVEEAATRRLLVGIESSMEELSRWLTEHEEQQPTRVVSSIVGSGGIGKTTLAKQLYRKLGRRFQCRAFVRSSQKPHVRRLLASILLQVRPYRPPSDSEARNLIRTVREHLQNKMYLIVIDGLWASSTWDIVHQALPDDNCCSRVLITTEVDIVARKCCGYNSKYIFNMQPLRENWSKELLFSGLPGNQSEHREQLTEASSEILRICGGFPLAIIAAASLLARQQDKIEQCKSIWRSLSSNFRIDSTVEEMMKQVLMLCYSNLPDHLKPCMLYLSIYKEDDTIWKEDLVKQWITEGFICGKEKKEMEQVAASYFDELVNRGIIEPEDIDCNDEVLSCTVHYMVLEFIRYKSMEENFVTAIDHSQTNIILADKVRRLSLHFDEAGDAEPPGKLRLSHVRSLVFSGLFKCLPSIAEFRHLQVLILHLWGDGDQDNITLNLATVCTLCRLRYLDIVSNVILNLQVQLQGLQYLDTLKIDSRVSEVPRDIVHLPALLHLSLPSDTELPDGIGRIASLETLGCFDLSSNSADNFMGLGQLTNVRDLRLTCSTVQSDNMKINMQRLGSILSNLSSLESLTLLPKGSSDANSPQASDSSNKISCDLSSVSSTPGFLKKLVLSPRICTFSRLPEWIGKLRLLSILKIQVLVLLSSDIDILKDSPVLTALSLYVRTGPAERIIFHEGFLILKHFKFICPALCLGFVKGAMPKVRRFKLGFSCETTKQYNLPNSGFENLACLEEISAKIGGVGADESIRKAVQSALEGAFSKHRSPPIINVRLDKQANTRYISPGDHPVRPRPKPSGRRRKPLHLYMDKLTGRNKDAWRQGRIRGTVVLMKKEVLDWGSFDASLLNNLHRMLGECVTFQLVSATATDPGNYGRGKVGKRAQSDAEEGMASRLSSRDGESEYQLPVKFEWDESQGIPGAVIVKNLQREEFFLKKLILEGEGVPGAGTLVFVANSWIYNHELYPHDRIFFANETYLPSKMPGPLVQYRRDELEILRGEDNPGPYKEHDRVYRYDYYNDLGEPDKGQDRARPILGGSQEYPYPRRCRTGRAPTGTDPNTETRPHLLNHNIYVPSDEGVGHLNTSDFIQHSLKAIVEAISSKIRGIALDGRPLEFDSFEDILGLYELGPEQANNPVVEDIRKNIPDFFRSVSPVGSHNHPLQMPIPHVIKTDVLKKAPADKFGWRTDEEFARQMLAGVNPVTIRCLTEFPAKSILDPCVYGDHTSKITEAHIQYNLEGLTVQNALRTNRLFILDHHDHFMPFLERINKLEDNFIYATRTLLLLKGDGTLKPLAIELSLPHPDGQQHGAVSKVYTPAHTGVEGHIWQLAKAYVCVNDSAWHQIVSHWLNTHAVMEPFVIATRRQLSAVHPVHKLLSPHYRGTMSINAVARQLVLNAGGLLELTTFPGKYALEMSSAAYKNWNFTEQALPADLVKRGVAVPDPSSPYGVRLLIRDYPYAVDGLAIWCAIELWVKEYLDIYYPSDGDLQCDEELQAWWKEVREVGHGDLRDRAWWPRMDAVPELARTCTTIIWVASALHAAVNFGQYAYAGYIPNRPAVSRRPMPEPGCEEYAQLERGGQEADRVFLRTFTDQFTTVAGVWFMKVLSKHSDDEVYLGQCDELELEARELKAFRRFESRLVEIKRRIVAMNDDPAFKNRTGPVGMPYTLLYPYTLGIPNSISI